MSEMSDKKPLNNGIKEVGIKGEGFSPGRCLVGRQRGHDCHPTTALRKWSKEDNKMAILFYYKRAKKKEEILVIERE